MKTNAFRFLLTMPNELNTAIETVAFSQRQSKSEFIREGLRRYLREVEFDRLQNKEVQEINRLVQAHQRPWRLSIAWFCISLGVTIHISVLFQGMNS